MSDYELIPTKEIRPWELGWDLRAFNGSVRKSRKKKGLTQKQLADVLNVKVQIIGGIETLRARPSPELRRNVADFLGLDAQEVWPDWLEPREDPIKATLYQQMDAKTFGLLDPKVRGEVLRLEDHSDAKSPIEISWVRERLDDVLRTLTAGEQAAIRLRFGLDDGQPLSLGQTGKAMGITKERVRQIEANAIRKLQKPVRANQLMTAAAELLDLTDEDFCPHCHNVREGLSHFCAACRNYGCSKCLSRQRDGEGGYEHVHYECLAAWEAKKT